MRTIATVAAALLVGACAAVTPSPTGVPTPTVSPTYLPTSSPSPTSAPTIGPFVDGPLPEDVAARLQDIIDRYLAIGTPSISAAVIVPGVGSWQGAVGSADKAANVAATPDTVYALGSITKTFIAALILRLVEQGFLDLDDPAAEHLGPVAGSKTNGATVRQLLSHRSGIFNYTNDPHIFDDRPWTFPELMDAIGEPSFGPGEQFEYSNTNYLLLGSIAEYVTGGPITELLHEHLLHPLGLQRTYYSFGESAAEPLAHGYMSDGSQETDVYDDSGGLPNANLASAARTAGAMSATASDVARWMFNLYSGNVLRAESLDEMLDFSASGSYGLGVGLTTLRFGRTAIGHDGGIPGFISVGNFDRESGVVVVVLTNSMALDMFNIQDDLFNAASPLTP